VPYLSYSLDSAGSKYALVDFPGRPRGEGREPRALLSFAAAGDMRFRYDEENPVRDAFLAGLGIGGDRFLGIELAHSRNVLFVHGEAAEWARPHSPVDGLLVSGRDAAPAVTVADCMPIWLLDRGSGAFGVLHSGWRGTGILGRAVKGLVERYGSDPGGMAAILGPAIGSCCYAVPGERAAAFRAEFGDEAAEFRGGRWFLDLRRANLLIARQLGLGELLSIENCTCCDPALGSYRRQGPHGFTRMLAACGRFAEGEPSA
jgi:YfiH family protein